MRHLFSKAVSYNRFVELEKRWPSVGFVYQKDTFRQMYRHQFRCTVLLYGYARTFFQRLFVNGIQLITKLKSNMKGTLMSLSDKLLLRKRTIIETVNDELRNISQVEHSRHRTFDNFIVNLLGAIAAYCCFPKKPCINVTRTIDIQLALFWICRTHVNLLCQLLLNMNHGFL